MERNLGKRPRARAWRSETGRVDVFGTNVPSLAESFPSFEALKTALAEVPLEPLERVGMSAVSCTSSAYLAVGCTNVVARGKTLVVRGFPQEDIWPSAEELTLVSVGKTDVATLDDVVRAVRDSPVDEDVAFLTSEGPVFSFTRATLAMDVAGFVEAFASRGVHPSLINVELASVGVVRVGRDPAPMQTLVPVASPAPAVEKATRDEASDDDDDDTVDEPPAVVVRVPVGDARDEEDPRLIEAIEAMLR